MISFRIHFFLAILLNDHYNYSSIMETFTRLQEHGARYRNVTTLLAIMKLNYHVF